MKVWYLTRKALKKGPREYFSMVVVADTQDEARDYAAGFAGLEGADVWRDPEQSSAIRCVSDRTNMIVRF